MQWWYRFLLLGLLLLPLPVHAQVTATVTDTGGQSWNNGTYTITLVPPTGGVIFTPQSFSGNLNGSGALSQALTPNAQLAPAGTQWSFQICPQATASCFITLLTITSANQNVTSSLVPPAIVISMSNPILNTTAYNSLEIVNATVGQEFFNLTTLTEVVCVALPCSGSNWTVPGTFTNLVSTANGGLSTGAGPSVSVTGIPVQSGGTTTTTVPLVYINSGIAPTTWSALGTIFGINSPSGFAGNEIDIHANGGVSVFKVSTGGGTTTTGNFSGIGYQLSGHPIFVVTAPTIAAAGCGGAAAAIPINNGTASFQINVGTTPTTGCTVTLPAATTDWNCTFTDATTQNTSVFLQKQSAWGTTTAAFTNWNTAGAATALVASDIIHVTCSGE